MKSIVRKALSAALAVAGLAAASNAQAVLVTYTVDGVAPQQFPAATTPPANAPWGVNGYPGDAVELQSYTATVDVPIGISYQQINTLLWTVNYTYGGTATDPNDWSELLFNVDGSRGMSIAGAGSGTLSQGGLLDVGWDNDYLSLSAGSTISFTLGGYQIDVTPLALGPTGAGDLGLQPPMTVMAEFNVTPTAVPEPATMVSGALLLLPFGASALRMLRKKVAA